MRLFLVIAIVGAPQSIIGPARAQQMAENATLDRILPEIRAQHPGRLSDAERHVGMDGQTHYRVKWVTPSGRIIFLEADPNTGRHRDTSEGDDDQSHRNEPSRP